MSFLDDVGDFFESAGEGVGASAVGLVNMAAEAGQVVAEAVAVAAPVVGLIPGIGSGVAVAMSAASSLALGRPIGDAVIGAVANAVPGGPLARMAAEAGAKGARALLEGRPVDEVGLTMARSALAAQGGPYAAAALDAGVAIARGQSLQAAGFQAVAAWAEGNDLAERAARFADAAIIAAREGRSPLEVAAEQAIAEVKTTAQRLAADRVLAALPDLPEGLDAAEVAEIVGVALPVVRAAMASAASGRPLPEMRDRFARAGLLTEKQFSLRQFRPYAVHVETPGLFAASSSFKDRLRGGLLRAPAPVKVEDEPVRAVMVAAPEDAAPSSSSRLFALAAVAALVGVVALRK